MFYPEDSLKRGGRFYLCWVADSWPLQFATITHRQLCSQDIRKICDDLLDVMTNESGRPAKRFSLRLSSQLLRGLVRLYQRKVTVLLGDLCMINATVMKNANKKWIVLEPLITQDIQRPMLPLIIHEEPEAEPRVEELIQGSGNVVANIEEITLKEPTMPANQLLAVNDGFGEMREGQMSGDQSIEAMRTGRLELPTDLSHNLSHNFSHNLSHDRSRLAPHDAALMERISVHDISMFNKSIGMELVQIEDFQKDIPEIPEIPPPDLIAPQTTPEETEVAIAREQSKKSTNGARKRKADEEIVLEELRLEEVGNPKGRGGCRLLIDKRCKLNTKQFRSRLACPNLHQRCQDASDDVVRICLPANVYFNRPAHGRGLFHCALSPVLCRMFARNLVLGTKTPLADREIEEAMSRPPGPLHSRSQLERIEEETEESAQREREMQIDMEGISALNITDVGIKERTDVAQLPTQVLDTSSHQASKRTSDHHVSAKRHCTIGYVSFRESQQSLLEAAVPAQEAEKENISSNIQTINESQKSVTAMLQKVGLADMQTDRPEIPEAVARSQRKSAQKAGSESSETPLGSLDRTKVSLGDSDKTTDSKRFIRDQWGTEGTMVKILNGLKAGLQPLNINTLVAKGPLIPGCHALIAARCFSSVLKLKQHGFINVQKYPDSLDIMDISLGPKFGQMMNK